MALAGREGRAAVPRMPHKGPLDFSEAVHAVMEQVIAKADPDAAADAEDADPRTHPRSRRPAKAARRALRPCPPPASEIARQAANERWAAAGE